MIFQQKVLPLQVDWAYCQAQILEQLKMKNLRIHTGDNHVKSWLQSQNVPFSYKD